MCNECLPKGKFFKGIVFLISCMVCVAAFTSADAQTLYSRKSGNWNDGTVLTGTWSALGHTGLACTCTPSAGSTVVIGNGHTVTYTSGGPAAVTITALTVNDAGGGTLTFGSGGAATTLTVSGDVTVNAGGTLQSGATSANAHTIIINGNLTNNGTVNLSAANQSITFNSASAKSITGASATITVNNMNVNGAGALSFGDNTATSRTLNVGGDLTIAAPATLQSGGNSTATALQTLALSGNLINNGTVNMAANGVTTHSMTFNSSSARTIRGSGTAITFYDMDVIGSGALTFADNTATSRTLKVTNNLTIDASATLQSGNSAAVAENIQVGGNITNDGTFNLTANAATNHSLVFIGSAADTVSGAGTFTFRNVTMNTTSSSTVLLTSSFAISGVLNFAANGVLILDANNNITLGTAGTITGFNSSRYIQVSGATGTNGNLIKTNGGSTAGWQITYPIGTATGGYTPLVLPTVGGVNPAANSTISVTAIFNASIQGQLRRTFRVVVAGNSNATTFTNPQFNYNTTADVSGGDALSNYSTIWYLSKAGGSWTNITGTAPGAGTFTFTTPPNNLVTGTYYYTIGASDAYPNTWYSYQTGVWSDWQNWTLDPSGTTLVNGLNLPPQPGDEINILTGITITNDVAGQVASSTTIQSGGTLDMVATSGNTLGTVSGSGLLRLQGVNLPAGTYTAFVATTGGTIEYYNTGGTLSSTQTTYNKLILSNSSTTTDVVFITASNLTINSTLNITQTGSGHTVTWQINDASNTGATSVRTITIAGDLTVSSGGKISVGTGNSGFATQHSLTLNGNFINNGVVQFYDPTDATYSSTRYNYNFTTDPLPLNPLAANSVYLAALRGNAVNVTFSGASDNTVSCNGQTDFYRLILDKGTGQQALLTLNSTAISNMRLFGPANLTSGTFSNNALSIQNGTLQLTGTLTIPLLGADGTATGGLDYTLIPQSGGLWINSAGVKVVVASADTGNDDQRLLCNGLLRVTAGSLISGYGRGLGSGSGGTLMVEGGVVETWQYRPLFGSTNVSYIQTGGTVSIGTTGYNGTATTAGIVDAITTGYARFSIPSSTSTFQMSGGTLNIGTPSQNTATTGAEGIDIQSSSGNFSVTGGTVNAYIPNSGTYNFGINSTSSFYNLNIYREGTAVTLSAILKQGITVANKLAIITGNTSTLNCNGQNLTVGGDFDIQTGTVLLTGANTITLNGSSAQSWNNNGTINQTTATANPALMNNIVVNKSAGTLTLNGTGGFPGSSTITNGTIAGLTLTSGTLADNGKTLTVTTTLSNSATHSGTGSIIASGPTAIGGSNGTFGNLTISTNGAVSTSGDQSVTGNLRLTAANSTLNIQSNSLTVSGGIYDAATGTTTAGFSTTKRIQTAGLRNDSGLTRKCISGTDLLFPVGFTTTTAYTPASINVTASTAGNITMRPVTGVHPTATPTGQSLQYYWRVTSSGFAGVSAVVHKSYTFSTASLLQGTLTTYKPARYDATTFTWSVGTTYNATGSTVIFPSTSNFSFGTNIDGEYTTGNITAGAITVFYSRQNGNWNDNNTWSVAPCSGPLSCGGPVTSGLFPSSTSAVVIGDLNNAHTVTIDQAGRTCGTLYIENTSTLDCSTFTGLNFGINTSQTVNGRGTLRIAAVTGGIGVFPGGDFTNFIGPTGGTIEWYGATKVLPTTGPGGLVLDNYYNLILNPSSGQTISLPPSNLTIYNTLTKNGAGTVATDITNLTTRVITLNGSFNVNAGAFNILTNTVGTANTAISNFILSGDLTIASGASFGASGGTATHTLTTSGNITNNGSLDFKNGSVVNATFTGTGNTKLTGTTATLTDLNNIVVNKGTSQTPVLTVDVNAITTLGTGWLTLTNGTINFNNSATYVLNTAASTYSIPSTAKLKTQLATVTIVNNGSNSADLLLSGTLEVAGGTVNIGNIGTNFNNDIEYASAGSPTIIVSGGNLKVNGAIRRPTLTLSGALVYNQSAGIVTVGGFNCAVAPNNTRGIFEIESNAGSSFTFSGGQLNVQRSTAGSSFADLYLNPETSSVSASSLIQFGMGVNTSVSTALTINIEPAIGSLSILGNATTAQTIDMLSSALTTLGTLSIASNSTLNTNALDVNIGGDLSISGTYNGTILTGNTTTFNGSGAQNGTLTAGSTFQDITINKPSGTATLSGTTSINNLNILNGILSVSGTLNINGDITNNSSQVGAGIINFLGTAATTAHTITSVVGSFTNLSLGGTASTKKITLNGNLTIDGVLDFTSSGTSRYLFIGSNQLTFSQTGSISNASSTRFIRTNGVSSDLGVVRNWKTGSSLTFNYAVGTRTNYTPVSYTLNVNNAGDITVIPVDDQHPTANATGQQILNYYWIVKRGSSLGLSNNTGTQSYQFPSSLIGGSGGTAIAAHLDAINLIGWTPSPGNGGAVNLNSPSAGNTTLLFTNLLNTNFPATGGEFDYTEGTTNTLPNPVTPVYSRFADADGVSNPTTVGNLSTGGNWNLATNWTLSSTGYGTAVSTVPAGRPIVILSGARMNMNIAGLSAFTSQINGLMVIASTTGHNLGVLSGTGTLRTSVSTLPAGNYTTFVSSAGGTIEYAAPITINSRTTYNNLSITASGSVAMTNADLTLNGGLTIAASATLDNSSFNRSISIAKDWTNNGTFTAGTGNVIFNGSTTQAVNGSTDFYNFTVLKSGNLNLAGTATTTVNNTLTLSTGYVIATSNNPLVIGSSATVSGGSVTSFVQGPVKRSISSGSTFTYPLGSTINSQYRPATIFGTSAPDNWTVQYVGHDPSLDSYTHTTFNTSNLGKVSGFEYWDIARGSTTSASVTLSYNTGSYIPTVIGTLANLRVAHWDGTKWDLPTGGGAFSQSGNTTAGTVTVTNVTTFSPFTFGSLDVTSPLPVKWLAFTAERGTNNVLLNWTTAQEINNDHFEIERSDDGLIFNPIGSKLAVGNSSTPQRYQFTDSEVSLSSQYYYRIKQIDADGKSDYSAVVVVKAIEGTMVHNWIGLPNPVKESQNFSIQRNDNSQADRTGPIQVQVITANGIVLFEGDDVVDALNKRLEDVFHNASVGIYLVHITDGTVHQSFRIVRY